MKITIVEANKVVKIVYHYLPYKSNYQPIQDENVEDEEEREREEERTSRMSILFIRLKTKIMDNKSYD